MNPELESQLREALARAIAVPNTLSPVTCETIIDYLVTGALDRLWVLRPKAQIKDELCSLVDSALYYACYTLYESLPIVVDRINRLIAEHHEP